MPSVTHDTTHVLVVGAGPAGLAAAIELARHDVPTLLVERRRRPSGHPRATVLSLRSMEVVRRWGLEERARARSVDVEPTMLEAPTLAQAGAGTAYEVGLPGREQSEMVSPTGPVCIAQDDVERLLLEQLDAAPRTRVAFATELTGIVARADGARATLRDAGTGAERVVDARFVVAADGARSAVRAALGIGAVGEDRVFGARTTLLHAPLWPVVGAHRHLLYSVGDDEAPGLFLPAGPGDRWLFGLRGDADALPPEGATARLVRRAAGVPDLPLRIEQTRDYVAGAQLAERWRVGPLLLAGDAAHRVTPRSGMGLNLALQGGADLGRRLGWVLRGWAAPALLDRYETERRPIAEHVAARSVDPQGAYRRAADELRTELAGRLAHVWTRDGRSTLDLLGPGLTLLADAGAEVRAPAAHGSGVPLAVRRLERVAARAVGAPAGGGVLAGPDGAPLGVLPAGGDVDAAMAVALAAMGALGPVAAARVTGATPKVAP